jgi:nucleoid-associated protein YgaU
MAAKKVTTTTEQETVYKPQAVDADLDGLVQDSTPYEREVNTHIVQKGDTWVSISEQYRKTKTNYSYAKELINKNNNTTLTKDAIIKL